MALTCHEVQSWTLDGLIGAFVDLALAYFLLCVSAFVFFASKLLKMFWLYLPCPCNGFLGRYRNRDLCLHKLLIDGPVAKINIVHELVKSKFPFDVFWSKDQRCNLNRKLIRDENFCENGVHELEGEAYLSPFSSPRLQNMVDRESGHDAKGKRVVVLKKKAGIRRSKRAAPDYVKTLSIFPNDTSRLVARRFPFPCDEGDTRDISGESSIPIAGREDVPQDDVKAQTRDNMGEFQNSKLSGSVGESKGVDISYPHEKVPIVGKETDRVSILQEALEEEKAACATLYLELEKERAAAATAADEAMAMISRLQKDKASIEMEVRQYQRMIEEKFVYDEEEMDVLKEILLSREKENHFLEKEVEAYRQMNVLGNEQSNGDLNDILRELGQKPSPSLNSNTDSLPTLQQTGDLKSTSLEVGNIADGSSQYEALFVEKQIHPNGHDSLKKCAFSSGEEKVHMANVMWPGMTTAASQANGIEKNLFCDEEERQQDGDFTGNVYISMLDPEPDVYDVHVIDGKTVVWKEESRSSAYTALDGPQEYAPTLGVSGVRSTELLQVFPSTIRVDTEPKINTSSLDTCCGLHVLDNSRCKTLVIDSTKNSLSAADSERLKIDTEVELLMERLQMLEERKEKLTSSSSERGERQKAPLKLLEEIRNPLRFSK